MSSLLLEIKFALGERTVRWTMALAILVSTYAVLTGLNDISDQQQQIEALTQEAQDDRVYTLGHQNDAGSAAYYVHHLTYDPPHALAFAASGSRSYLPWKHRITMLALEGQIYESDVGNPELARLGKLDYAFLIAVLSPLLLILLLYDLDARERRAGLYELLCATSQPGAGVFWYRACARMSLLLLAVSIPFLFAVLFSGAPWIASLKVLAVTTGYFVFWTIVCRLISARGIEGVTAAIALLGIWLMFAIVIPVGGKVVVERTVTVPAGGEILLAQREAVNDAWDLPKEATMTPFIESHPRWRDRAEVTQPFDWKWYYAFQQVGDQHVAADSQSLRRGITERDHLMSGISLLSPPLWIERQLSQIAHTDVRQHLQYAECVRAFHARLREFHYPMLFGEQPYSEENMVQLPVFTPCQTAAGL